MKKTNSNKTKGKITGIVPGLVLIIGLVFLCVLVNSTTKDIVHIEKILDVNDYYKTSTETLSMEEIITKLGEPEKIEKWEYTKSEAEKIPLETLSYNNYTYEYTFKDNLLVEIAINKKIPYNTIKDIYTMFNLTKYESTQENNTGSAIRILNSSVPDFWCGINDKNLEWIKIRFFNNIF